MLTAAKSWLRTRLRSRRLAGAYPILLPHFRVEGTTLSGLGIDDLALSSGVAQALSACQGSQSLHQIVAASGADLSKLLELHDCGTLIFWNEALGAPSQSATSSIIVMAPHPDDAALSVGQTLFTNQGASIVCVFSRTSWWRWGDEMEAKVTQIRHAEERLAASLLGSPLELMNLPEGPIRGHSFETVFSAATDERDAEVHQAIKAYVFRLSKEREGIEWRLPMGIGNHIDHRIVRDASLEALQEAKVSTGRIGFYEDLPYAAKAEPSLEQSTVMRALGLRRVRVNGPDRQAVRWKKELMKVYWSQLTAGQVQEVYEHTAKYGEWMWVPSASWPGEHHEPV
jgi:LmbE family N-acetylglucosaminyl deacetylase